MLFVGKSILPRHFGSLVCGMTANVRPVVLLCLFFAVGGIRHSLIIIIITVIN